ncbi:LacI family DNA-binding transcriptional regulator [Arthrobacter sp. NyZ413]|uniref:LacI family DNA-binding transcriptional regulator n=1 Tax=Arthrobacter sp. NyZ413 TaxID=3144669 RepID=UPI003BF80A96
MPEPDAGARSPRQPTIRDVAERAGVSKSLVSLVLRDAPHVSDARRMVVLEAIAELGYKPNAHARGLSRTKSDTIGVLLNDLRNPWFVDVLEALTATLHASGLSPVLADSYTDQRVGRRSVEAMVQQGIDGLVVVGTTPEFEAIQAAAEVIPVVLAGTRDPKLPNVDIVVNDDAAGARAATQHLIDLGHTHIAHLSGPGEIGQLRLAGFREAMIDAGLDPEEFAETGGMSEESGYAASRRLLVRRKRPTGIFAFNDIAAIGALSAAADQGLHVPSDLSVVGYDNTYLSRIRHLSLTSVDNGNFAIGVQAGRFLAERLEAPVQLQRIHLVPATLEVRGSTAAPPAGK